MLITNDDKSIQELNKSFRDIMYSEKYAERGFRKYRVLFFCYLFGCIESGTLFALFPEDDSLEPNEQKISYANTLNYFHKQCYLAKEKNFYYTLTNLGSLTLYQLLSPHLSIDQDAFIQGAKVIKLFCNHAITYGITTLTYARNISCSFQVEVPLGNILNPLNIYEKHLLFPDVTIKNHLESDTIYIEADCSSEKRNSALIPKLSNYVNYFICNSHYSSTILFSIWGKDTDYKISYNLFWSEKQLLFLYNFYNEISGGNISFSFFIKEAIEKRNSNPILSSLIPSDDFLFFDAQFPTTNYTNQENIFDYYLVKRLFSKNYFSRQKYIFDSYKFIPDLKHCLLNGMRLITIPISTSYFLQNLLLFNNDFILKILDYYINLYYSIYTLKSYNFIEVLHAYNNEFSYVFRNIFVIETQGKNITFAFENISEDLGGYYRAREYIINFHKYPLSNFILVCVYNNFTENDLLDFYNSRYPSCDLIQFLSYEKILFSIISRHEKDH